MKDIDKKSLEKAYDFYESGATSKIRHWNNQRFTRNT